MTKAITIILFCTYLLLPQTTDYKSDFEFNMENSKQILKNGFESNSSTFWTYGKYIFSAMAVGSFLAADNYSQEFDDNKSTLYLGIAVGSTVMAILSWVLESNSTEIKPTDIDNKFPIQENNIPMMQYQSNELSVDVDQNIRETNVRNQNAVAVVIGNKNYINPTVPPVDFAINDASVVRDYLKKTFGYDSINVIYETDATQSKFISIFGTEKYYKGKLYNYVKEGQSDVFVYYSGHGAPDPESKQGYFLPVDCDPSMVALTGYSLNTFYENLSKINYKSLTVVIDACFSGTSDRGTLLKNVSPIFISIDNPVISKENASVFTSANGDQVSSWYPEKKHSLFTYYFLKGIKGEANSDNDNTITVGEIEKYVLDNVPYMARRLNNREQTPQVIGENKSKELVGY